MNKLSIYIVTLFLSVSISGCLSENGQGPQKVLQKTQSNEKQVSEEVNSRPNDEVFKAFASVDSGDYEEPFMLSLSSNVEGAEVYFTNDPKNYKIENFDKYSIPIIINKDTLIRFYAKKNSKLTNVVEKKYQVKEQKNGQNIFRKEDPIKNFIEAIDIKPPPLENPSL